MNIYNVTSEDIRDNIINLHNLVFEVTDNCNLRCEYCVIHTYMKDLIVE